MQSEKLYISGELIDHIVSLTIPNAIFLFVVAILFFIYLPRWIFPQKFGGAGLEQNISNIIYMLAYIELVVPLMIYLKVFTLFTFAASFILTKILFFKFYYKRSLRSALSKYRDKILVAIFDFLDHDDRFSYLFRIVRSKIEKKVERLDLFVFFKRTLLLSVFIYAIYSLGYRSFVSLSNPLPDTSQFVEWVATLHQNILYADNKSPGPDFYGIAIFIFVLQVLTNIDSILLFSLYPLLLIAFLLFGVYFVMKRFTLSYWSATATLVVYAFVLIGSPLNKTIITPVAPLANPEIVEIFGFKLYTIPTSILEGFTGPYFEPYMRYMSGMAYEFASTFFLLNLFYLIKTLDTHRNRYLLHYGLTLLLVFIFHGGGAVALAVPSVLIALNAFFSGKIDFQILRRGIGVILVAVIFGNGWMLSMLKYGLPQDIGAAAPFLDTLLGTKQAIENLKEIGLEEVTISFLTKAHLLLLVTSIALFLLARSYKKAFYFSSFLLIPIGVMIIYFAENIGLPKLIHQARAAEYFLLGMTILIACFWKIVFGLIKLFFLKLARYIQLIVVTGFFLVSVLFIPHYYKSDIFRSYLDRLHYSDSSQILYLIANRYKPHTWTAVGIVEDYSKVLGKGYFINANDFILRYSPTERFLKIPTRTIFILIEDIPHKFHESDEWYYRWRKEIMDALKSWVSIYSATHKNIKIYYRTDLVTAYEIDNSEYIKSLQKNEN